LGFFWLWDALGLLLVGELLFEVSVSRLPADPHGDLEFLKETLYARLPSLAASTEGLPDFNMLEVMGEQEPEMWELLRSISSSCVEACCENDSSAQFAEAFPATDIFKRLQP
jgi:hypothetical protein